jgi:hypothetical protein
MELDEWLTAVGSEIGTADLVLDADTIQVLLDLARDAAHEIERVAAPLTTFLVGVAVGRGAQLEAVVSQTTALAMRADSTSGAAPSPPAAESGQAPPS